MTWTTPTYLSSTYTTKNLSGNVVSDVSDSGVAAVAWVEQTGGQRAFASIYSNGSWSTPTELTSASQYELKLTGIKIAPDGSIYVCMLRRPTTGISRFATMRKYSSGSWQAAVDSPSRDTYNNFGPSTGLLLLNDGNIATLLLVSTNTVTFLPFNTTTNAWGTATSLGGSNFWTYGWDVSASGDIAVAWDNTLGVQVRTSSDNGATWTTQTSAAPGTSSTTVTSVQWGQDGALYAYYRVGNETRATRRSGGTWTATTFDTTGSFPPGADSTALFYDTTTSLTNLLARTYTGGAWASAVTVNAALAPSTDSRRISALNATSSGLATAVWAESGTPIQIKTKSQTGTGTWSGTVETIGSVVDTTLSELRLAMSSTGSLMVVTWMDRQNNILTPRVSVQETAVVTEKTASADAPAGSSVEAVTFKIAQKPTIAEIASAGSVEAIAAILTPPPPPVGPASGLSAAYEDLVGGALLAGETLSGPNTVYMALYVGDPQAGGVEVAGGGYTRQSIVFAEPTSPVVFLSSSAVEFPPATASWGEISHVGLVTAASGGDLIMSGELVDATGTPAPRSITANRQVGISAGTLAAVFS